MYIKKVRVEGFRLLQDVEIMLESKSTVIVGRNNSGKTSFTDIFNRFIGEKPQRFRLEDFSAGMRLKFFKARELWMQQANPDLILAALPKITLTLTFEYNKLAPDLGPLSPFVIDIDDKSSDVIVRIDYAPTLAALPILLNVPTVPDDINSNEYFLRSLKSTIQKAYRIKVFAIDPTDEQNQRYFENPSVLTTLIQCDFVHAQRTLDHLKNGDTDVIGKLLSNLFKTATTPTAAAADQALAAQLKISVEGIERNIQHNFDDMLKRLLPAMDVLGFPSLNDTELCPETSLNVEALLSDHTRIVYLGADGINLPEGYNGLGTRNLIYMLLQLEGYHKSYRAKAIRPSTHLIFIEEPEAHLHPQMQEVFINQLNAAISKLSAQYPSEPAWKTQFIISTHSSHIANAAPFEAIRYFLNDSRISATNRQTKAKDFKKGIKLISPEDQEFLHQYMTLTKCDLYFADKAILVEGTTERLLMPKLCELVDNSLHENNKLARQYVTSVEVGGAYAHIFYPLLDFLELKTLVITDLDAVHAVIKTNKNGKDSIKWEKCPVSIGARTSNTAIKEWFSPKDDKHNLSKTATIIKLTDLITKNESDKISGYRRIAYQIPEEIDSEICARSYEDALVLANPKHFNLVNVEDEALEAWNIAQNLSKTETAFRFAIKEKDWIVPRYIREGLIWLSEPSPCPAHTETTELCAVPAITKVEIEVKDGTS